MPTQARSYDQVDDVLRETRAAIEQAKGRYATLISQRTTQEANVETAKKASELAKVGMVLLQQASSLSRYQLKALLEPLLTEAMQLLLGGKAGFELKFTTSRDTVQAHLITTDSKGVEGEGIEAHGGGVIDVESVLLRLVFLLRSGLPPTLIMDEPFRNVHGGQAVGVISSLLNRLCKDLGYQVILVTGEEAVVAEKSDAIIVVSDSEHGSVVTTH